MNEVIRTLTNHRSIRNFKDEPVSKEHLDIIIKSAPSSINGQYVYPICGLVVGHPADHSGLKPRLPQRAVHHEEKYNPDLLDVIKEYDETISQYISERTNGKESRNWSQPISKTYSTVYFPKVDPTLEKQGFGK